MRILKEAVLLWILIVTVFVACSCSSDDGPTEPEDNTEECRAQVAEHYNPWDYIGWRVSRMARFSSLTHAMPCSVYVASMVSTTPVSEVLSACPEADAASFYDLVGRYDQFVVGWDDIVDSDGNRVAVTQVDSAENFLSQHRLTYVEECLPE